MTNQRIALLIATIGAGLIAGFFLAYDASVTLGLADVDDITYVTTFQAINDNIRNPRFGLIWWGTIPAITSAAWLHREVASPVRALTAAGLGLYLIAVMVTGTGNLPLNEELADIGELSAKSAEQARDDFEDSWNDSNRIRTLTAAGSFVCLAAALAVGSERGRGKSTGSSGQPRFYSNDPVPPQRSYPSDPVPPRPTPHSPSSHGTVAVLQPPAQLDTNTQKENTMTMQMTAPPMPPPLFGTATSVAARARSATKVYGTGDTSVVALDNVDIDFKAGSFTAIMGPSGSGKSTLMHCVAGLDRLSSGSAFVGETSVAQASEQELTRLRRDRLGFVFQAFNLLPMLTALENITLPADLAGNTPDQVWLDKVIEAVGLTDRLGHRPAELSGGQQQRVAVARALVNGSEIIFADEPTGNLDSVSGAEVLDFMRYSVRELGQTIVMVTHDAVAASYANRVVFLADGRVTSELTDPTPAMVHDHMSALRNGRN